MGVDAAHVASVHAFLLTGFRSHLLRQECRVLVQMESDMAADHIRSQAVADKVRNSPPAS